MWPTSFAPLFSNTASGIVSVAPVVVAASTVASAATALPGNVNGDGDNPDILIQNQTNGWAFCVFADLSANVPAATLTNGIGVAPGASRMVRVQPSTAWVAVILATGATGGSVNFVRGAGLYSG